MKNVINIKLLPGLIAAVFIFLVYFLISRSTAEYPVIDQKYLLKIFTESKIAVEKGFDKEIPQRLIKRDFFFSYSEILKVLRQKENQTIAGRVNYLAAMALLANNRESPENRKASLITFFRYFPEIVDDTELFIKVISHIGRKNKKPEKDHVDREIYQAARELIKKEFEKVQDDGEKKSALLAIFPEFSTGSEKKLHTDDPIQKEDSLIKDTENDDVS